MAVLLSLLYLSCTDIYDNVKEFSKEEIVYPAHFDTVYHRVGFERVEIDLSRYGRIPASRMNLGKAKKTVILYDKEKIVYDSLCSWVNITNLTQPKLYRFKIFTEDEFGNQSTPIEVSATPFTSNDRDALGLPVPVFLESTTVALVEWKNPISSDLFDMLSYTYTYADKNDAKRSGSGDGDFPSFFIENVKWGEPVTVTITSRIVPKLDKIPILDTIIWSYPMTFAVEGTLKSIFLDKPFTGAQLNVENSFPYTLSWKKAEGVTDYNVVISTLSTFPQTESIVIPVGNVESYALKHSDISDLLAQHSAYANAPLYWKVIPADNNPEILTQSRQFNVQRKVKKSYLMEITREGERWTTSEYFPDENVYEIKVNDGGRDPWLYSVGLKEAITDKAITLSYEYRTTHPNASVLSFVFEYFASTPSPSGSKMWTETVPLVNEWTSHVTEFGTYAALWQWGAVGHRFRLDPGTSSAITGMVLYLKDFRIDAYE
jgi:hypothetical protein